MGIWGLVALPGCIPPADVEYRPVAPATVAIKASVGLTVRDERPADEGAGTARIGSVLSRMGIPSSIDDSKPDVAVRTVTDATTHALRRAGVGIQQDSPKRLVASVQEFWFSGSFTYVATVAVAYKLTDAKGNELWTSRAEGRAGGPAPLGSAQGEAERLLNDALTDLSDHASELFDAPAFQQALQR